MAEASSAHPAVERLLQNHAAFEASVAPSASLLMHGRAAEAAVHAGVASNPA